MNNVKTIIIPRGSSQPYEFYSNNADKIMAKINKWSSSNIAEEIIITSSIAHREFVDVVYCDKLDIIEIHCKVKEGVITSSNTPTKPFAIQGCRIGCTRVRLIEYSESNPDLERCKLIDITQPDTKKGNIIVGNP